MVLKKLDAKADASESDFATILKKLETERLSVWCVGTGNGHGALVP